MKDGILSTVGGTPLLQLNRIFPHRSFNLYAKLEAFNPGGSIKDSLERGTLRPGMTVIESSSGNMGIGLAQACTYLGLRFICVVDPRTTEQHINILKAYGADVDLVAAPDPATGEYLQARINRVKALQHQIPNSFWPNQYANPDNPSAHYQTMSEIITEVGGEIDFLLCATSTCGTLRGCAEHLRRYNMKTKIYAVDAVGSVIFGGSANKRLIPGHGASIKPELYRDGLANSVIHVTDLDCVVGCRLLVQNEAILAGGSSGAVLMALERIKNTIPPRANAVLIFPDRGERYLNTIYSDQWVKTHFGDVSHLWQQSKEPIEESVCKTAS
jgi:cysteine synthase A